MWWRSSHGSIELARDRTWLDRSPQLGQQCGAAPLGDELDGIRVADQPAVEPKHRRDGGAVVLLERLVRLTALGHAEVLG